jgi:hypothetical protein
VTREHTILSQNTYLKIEEKYQRKKEAEKEHRKNDAEV